MKMSFAPALILFTGAFIIVASGCETNEQNKVAEAQQCLDRLSDSATAADAQPCLNFISGITSPSAYVIRCSVDFLAAGINPTQLIAAFQAMKTQSSAQQTATLMGALAESAVAPLTALQTAQATLNDCVSSETPSLIYLAGVSVTGTALVVGGGSATPATFIANCQATPASCSPDVIGSAAVTLASSYCTGSNVTSEVCITINSAVAAGGSTTAIGDALIASLH